MHARSATTTLALLLTVGLHSGAALADDRATVIEAFTKAMAKGQYTAQMVSQVKGRPYTTELQVVFPDSYRMKSPDAEFIILPKGTWMNAGGQWMKVPMNMSKMIAGHSKQAMEKGVDSLTDVRRAGTEDINGCTSDIYHYRASGEYMGLKNSSEVQAAICRDSGLPVRLVSEGRESVTIHYDFESPVTIRAPN